MKGPQAINKKAFETDTRKPQNKKKKASNTNYSDKAVELAETMRNRGVAG